MMIEPLVKDLLEAGVHFGHQTHRWNPKMKRFIFGEKNGIYLLDLEKTAQGLSKAQEFLRAVAAKGGHILFIGTKRQAQPIVREEAVRCGQYYVSLRWLGGLLTNFQTVRKSLERLRTLRSWRDQETSVLRTKKEASRAEKEIQKLEKVFCGIEGMHALPRAIVVVDAKREETAVKEAIRLGIPLVGLVDTNSDPDPIAYVIPGNDDAIRSIRMVLSRLADAIQEGHQAYLAGVAEEQAKSQPKPEPVAVEPPPAAELPPAETGPEVPPVEDVEAIIPDAAHKKAPKLKVSHKPGGEGKGEPAGE